MWGYCGILSLGHALFFALGGYVMGMYLMRSIGREGVYRSDLPDFMVFLDWHRLPWYWEGTEHLWYALALVVLVPGVLAWVFGFFTFRSRMKGVYLSIITQATTFAAMLLFYRNETGFGGNNGFTDFKRIAGFSVTHPGTRMALFLITFAVLAFLAARWIVTSKLGRVVTGVRDGEVRLMFLGYSPLAYKLFIWTVSAVLCDIAGALYVSQVGIINPSEMSPANSIEMAIGVAVGGRGTLIGPIIGAFAVNGAKSFFTAYFAEYWLFSSASSLRSCPCFCRTASWVSSILRLAGRRMETPQNDCTSCIDRGFTTVSFSRRGHEPQRRCRSWSCACAWRDRRIARHDPLSRRRDCELRRLSRARQADAFHRRRRAALRDRYERCGQDRDDGRHHRKDAA
ncbi:Urea ABC transporter, permease protein UrtC [Candidatus Paraburkholderia kirkii UZHbot1]|uniref:Urea ABC transporter, permease protein UrtC n=1 Tax=Candidatus Paraburkholderia kirkii UZHbot1 TaxID=1055526 RepID=G4MDF1_9BURK|nr:Urea ABC transporter, permease protein UrtC [Candidatus Paraburkholderia kirkii UZHbot1]